MKKKFQMPSSFSILFLIIALMALMTWIIPAGQYEKNESGNLISGTYHEVEPNKQGLYEVMMAPVYGMLGKDTTLVQSNGEVIHVHTNGAIQVSFFILMVGGFLGVVSETGALDIGIASVVKKHKGKEKRLIPILMILCLRWYNLWDGGRDNGLLSIVNTGDVSGWI